MECAWKSLGNGLESPIHLPYGNLKEFISKSIENLSGELLATIPMETLWSSSEKQCEGHLPYENLMEFLCKIKRKLVWRASGHYPYGNLMELLSVSEENLAGEFSVTMSMECHCKEQLGNPFGEPLSLDTWKP